MNDILSLICTFIIMMILFTLIGPVIIYLLPVILIILFFKYLFMPKRTTHTYHYDSNQDTYQTSKPKHDAIDVEYTEHDEDEES